jgi:putative transposase
MAKNWKNFYIDNAVHHITGTVQGWQPILLLPEILNIFYLDCNHLIIRWEIKLYAYVIMPEHFHLLAQCGQGINIMRFIQGVRRSVSGRARHLIEKPDSNFRKLCAGQGVNVEAFYQKTAGKSEFRFWKEKPRVIPLVKNRDIKQKLDYIHNNPVRRNLCKEPGNWVHSSFNCYYDNSIPGLPIYNNY